MSLSILYRLLGFHGLKVRGLSTSTRVHRNRLTDVYKEFRLYILLLTVILRNTETTVYYFLNRINIRT